MNIINSMHSNLLTSDSFTIIRRKLDNSTLLRLSSFSSDASAFASIKLDLSTVKHLSSGVNGFSFLELHFEPSIVISFESEENYVFTCDFLGLTPDKNLLGILTTSKDKA